MSSPQAETARSPLSSTNKGPKSSPKGPKESQGLIRDLIALVRLWPYLKTNKTLMVYALLLIPVISLFQAAIPMVLRHAVDDGISKSDFRALWLWASLFGALVVTEYLCRTAQTLTTSYAVFRMIRDLRLTRPPYFRS